MLYRASAMVYVHNKEKESLYWQQFRRKRAKKLINCLLLKLKAFLNLWEEGNWCEFCSLLKTWGLSRFLFLILKKQKNKMGDVASQCLK